MTRFARVVLPDFPHHVTQRGNRRGNSSFHEEDKLLSPTRAFPGEVEDWAEWLSLDQQDEVEVQKIRRLTNRDLTLKKRGGKPKEKELDPRQGDLFDE